MATGIDPNLHTPRADTRGAARWDARWLQIVALCAFLAYVRFGLGGAIVPSFAATAVLACVAIEAAFAWRSPRGISAFDFRSPLITGLSLALLLRGAGPQVAALAALLAIGGKHLLRVRGKQVFNPSNFAIALLTAAALLPGAHAAPVSFAGWISPGTWGHTAVPVAAVACIGMLVTMRATRLDLALAFLLGWAAALFARALWLGDPLAIPLHQLQDGTLLVFAFFMITDPRATPDRRAARVAFAALLVLAAYVLRFHAYAPEALLWALACISPLSPLFDRWLPSPRFEWRAPPARAATPRAVPLLGSST